LSRRVIPPWIFCPRCGSQLELSEDRSPETVNRLKEQGYEAAARGVCKCGVVAVLCYQPLPKSPTFSLFFDIYVAEAVRPLITAKRLGSYT
jgi:hypothetical protein